MMIDISVIIPLYKGSKYLNYLMDILTVNFEIFYEKYHRECEVIFINDFPEEKIILPENKLNTRLFNMEENQGIYKSRVFGCLKAEGNYVLFLDQDDKISENYLISQRETIGDADAVVCNGYNERICTGYKKELLYDSARKIEKTKFADNYIRGTELTQITSPGQVLIRKNAIPNLWLTETIHINGSDDFYLWILMLRSGCEFTCNMEKLYIHVDHVNNASAIVDRMHQSLEEVSKLLEKNGYLDKEEVSIIQEKNDRIQNVPHRKIAQRFSRIIKVYDYWMYLNIRKRNIKEYFDLHQYNKIAIYGMDPIGNRLYDELYDSSVQVICGIDRNAEKFEYEDIPVLTLESRELEGYLEKVDIIVVTALTSYPQISENLRKKFDKPIVSMEDILLEVLSEMQG